MTDLGKKLRELRESRGWTQEQAEEASGVPQTTISAIENGKAQRPSDANLARLAATYGVSRASLYAAAKLIESIEDLLQRPASPADPLWVMMERVRADQEMMRQLAALEEASAPDVFDEVVESVAEAWKANLKMGLRVAVAQVLSDRRIGLSG